MIHITLLGYGTVGKSIYKLLNDKKNEIEKLINNEYTIDKILVKTIDKHKSDDVFNLITNNINEVLSDENIDVLFDATNATAEIIKPILNSISNGKHFISANKALVSRYMVKLVECSDKSGSKFKYEASVAAAIPVLSAIKNISTLNTVTSIDAVLNGTCNYILSKMEEGLSYEDALLQAQKIGFAEADPSADVDGFDTLRKLRILTYLVFNKLISEDEIACKGISGISKEDIKKIKNSNLRYKLIAHSDGNKAVVFPTLVEKDSILGGLNNGENAVIIKTVESGDFIWKGLGAGGHPTAFSMVSDFINIYDSQV